MSEIRKNLTSRRGFLKTTGAVAAASVLPSISFPNVHMQSSGLIQVALVGCGGRGSGAAVNALSTKSGPIKLVAMADAFQDRLNSSYKNLTGSMKDKMDVPAERQFVGFEAYKDAMDCLNPGDIVILTTPPAFRWVHFQYAISKKLHVFMEKPVTVDGPTSKKMLSLADAATAANLKVGVGLMSRHSKALIELQERISNGELGEILMMRGYRMHGPAGNSESIPKPPGMSHLEYQVRRFHSFLWASGGLFSDFYIHHVDHLCWMKGAWPVSAQAIGARHYKENAEGIPFIDQNFDNYSVEYTFADGSKFFFDGRCVSGAKGIYSSYVHGTKGMAVAARANDCGGPSSIHKGQSMDSPMLWQSDDETNPYQNEWDALVTAIRSNQPFNEVKRGVEASLVSSMGRMAAHTGQEITFDQMLNCPHEFAPDVDKLTTDGEAPLAAGSDGRYPVPQPGRVTTREF
ncbi:Gfo/Idh/MocA family oxidoreductase [Kamptonema cortianum]|nr:Gfo/Idh/MocA family oxidoreductase [Geitlerinema splendidum]MDK3157083.1 Gfo/Idh/MocA family oxidoreductase [Kamptonema cortianum]